MTEPWFDDEEKGELSPLWLLIIGVAGSLAALSLVGGLLWLLGRH